MENEKTMTAYTEEAVREHIEKLHEVRGWIIDLIEGVALKDYSASEILNDAGRALGTLQGAIDGLEQELTA